MKKIRYVTGLWLIAMSLAVSAQDRGVVWTHGLNEDAAFWAGYQAAFNAERRMFSSNPSLNSTQGVVSMANQVRGASAGASGTNSIAIGHSMGGVALREVARQNPGFAGGIITVGSPMNGARIANALRDGEVDAAVLRGAQDMAAGPSSSLGSLASGVFGPFSWVGTLIGYGGGRVIINQFIPNVVGDIRRELLNGTGQSAIDLSQGSAYLRQAIPASVNMPRISVYGNENSPTLFRLASSAATNGADDMQFVNTANELGDVYDDAYEQYKGTTIVGRVWRVFVTTGSNLFIADQWKKGRDYIREYAEADWVRMIGATRTEYSSWTDAVMTCAPTDYSNCVSQTCMANPGPNCIQPCYARCFTIRTFTFPQYIQQPSDAFIHQDSQTGANRFTVQNSAWNPNFTYEALGANHLEQGNHPSMNVAFRRIWNNEDNVANGFFAIARR